MLDSVAILYHRGRPRAVSEAKWLEQELQRRGVTVSAGDGWDPEVVADICRDRNLLFALGGDGTILHVARLAAPFGVPTLGVNMGRIGFLAEMNPQDLHEHLDEIVAAHFWVERRIMLDAEWHRDTVISTYHSLNEVAVARGASARAVHVDVQLDGQDFMTFTADGILVATATGSTAYSLAAGGPILYPEATDLLITPVAPHLHIGRSIIVPGDMTVTLKLSSDRPAVMAVDGCDEHTLRPNHAVHVYRSEMIATFARLGPRAYFYSAIAERLK